MSWLCRMRHRGGGIRMKAGKIGRDSSSSLGVARALIQGVEPKMPRRKMPDHPPNSSDPQHH
eukprot:scaffold118139_cov30-Tisochrysis_lutea.AAC.2